MEQQKNVFGDKLEVCGYEPMTGFYRDGTCNTEQRDLGSHTVCVQVTEEFLNYSKSKGNDLSTPVPEFDFPGLVPGDRWCVCAQRWFEAYKDGVAPKVVLLSTNQKVLDIIPLDVLKSAALDLA